MFDRRARAVAWVMGAWLLASCSSSRPRPPSGTATTAKPPVFIELPATRLPAWTLGAATSSEDGRVLYVGASRSRDPRRLNLVAAQVGADGAISDLRSFADGPEPLPEGADATVAALLADVGHRKLYVGEAFVSPGGGATPLALTVHDLDAAGFPVGRPRSYDSGNKYNQLAALARHPRLPILYGVGWGGTALFAYPLDAGGEPSGAPRVYPVGDRGKYAVALSADGARAYLGTYPDALEVVELDRDGAVVGKARAFAAGTEKEYLRFELGPAALYLTRPTPSGPRLAVWPLDRTGAPVGAPRVQSDVPATLLHVDRVRGRLWISGDEPMRDAFGDRVEAGGTRVLAFDVARPDGATGPAAIADKGALLEAKSAARLALGPDGRPLLLTTPLGASSINNVRGYKLTVSLIAAGDHPTAGAKFQVRLTGDKTNASLGTIAIGETTAPFDLDPVLRDRAGRVQLVVAISPNPGSMKLRIGVAHGEGGGAFAADEALAGGVVRMSLPGYRTRLRSERLAAIEMQSAHAKGHLQAARAVAIPPSERPRQFVLATYHLLGGQGDLELLRNESETVASLGFNTVDAYWWDGLPPEVIDSTLDSYGLTRRSSAIYAPPSYFESQLNLLDVITRDAWAKALPKHAAASNGGLRDDVVLFHLADEPGWYYPGEIDVLAKSPARVADFRAYLRTNGLSPSDFAKTGWDAVTPIRASAVHDLPTHKLYYHLIRFFGHDAARGFRVARDAVEHAFGHRQVTAVNWNNFVNRTYAASPGAHVGNNPIDNVDSAMGSMDWFEAARENACTPWTEDWFADTDAQVWSYYGDALRSVAALGPGDFGGYVVGQSLGGMPHGGRYKVLSLIGHGAKTISAYTYGPSPFTGDAWSENRAAYGSLADAFRLVGRAESLLHPGRPSRGSVALLSPGASLIWERSAAQRAYEREVGALHFALTHAGYPVDLVDEVDLASDALAQRGYATLYVTEPNVPAAALRRIEKWVAAGGTLVVTPGAAVADEYDSPSSLLDATLGLGPRLAVRDPVSREEKRVGRATGRDEAATIGSIDLAGFLQPLVLAGARAIATTSSGQPVLTLHEHGKGRALAYGFFPGALYANTPDRSDATRLPRGWGDDARRAAVLGAQMARAAKHVVLDQEVVEAARLDSDKGIAIVLLNWTGVPRKSVKVTVPRASKFSKARSVEQGPLASTVVGDAIVVALPLADVDVVMLE